MTHLRLVLTAGEVSNLLGIPRDDVLDLVAKGYLKSLNKSRDYPQITKASYQEYCNGRYNESSKTKLLDEKFNDLLDLVHAVKIQNDIIFEFLMTHYEEEIKEIVNRRERNAERV